MVSRRSARFCELSDAFDAECRRRGYPLRPGAADDMLTSRIRDVAVALHIKESSAFATYFDETWPMTAADGWVRSVESMQAEQSGPPVVLPAVLAAQLVSGLGVVARFAMANVEHARADECVLTGSQAGQALEWFGLALRQSVEDPTYKAEMLVTEVERPAVHAALEAIDRCHTRLSDESWRGCWCGADDDPQHTDIERLLERLGADLRMLRRLAEGR